MLAPLRHSDCLSFCVSDGVLVLVLLRIVELVKGTVVGEVTILLCDFKYYNF
jgi:hypothetical protein